MATAPEYVIYKCLSTDGNGGGTTNANGNYAAAITRFYIQPPAGEQWTLTRMIGEIHDTTGFTAQEYGNLGTALTNGITVNICDDSGVLQTLAGGIKYNAEWGAVCYDTDVKSWGAGDEFLVFRWTFEKDVPGGIVLDGNKAQALEMLLNDDLTGLIEHSFAVRGYNSGALRGTGGLSTGNARTTLYDPSL